MQHNKQSHGSLVQLPECRSRNCNILNILQSCPSCPSTQLRLGFVAKKHIVLWPASASAYDKTSHLAAIIPWPLEYLSAIYPLTHGIQRWSFKTLTTIFSTQRRQGSRSRLHSKQVHNHTSACVSCYFPSSIFRTREALPKFVTSPYVLYEAELR